MNQRQLNSLTMFKAVLAHLDTRPTLWNTSAPLTKVIFSLRTFVAALHQQSLTQAERTTVGYTQDKDGQMQHMCDLAYALLLKIRSYAKINNNKALLYAINYSESEIRRGPEIQIINRCQTIHNKGKEHFSDLKDFLVTEENLTELQEAIDTLKPLSAQRDSIASERVTATANISLLLEGARTEIDKLDDLIEGLIKDKNFVNTYKQARQIIDRGISSDAELKKKIA
ncbi:hypothetical protein GXP67_10795 [Rhodocytophaga rosea]|uniref:Uncharacterized protein n=1 Tax=Rhodocytophaga rosea TaxID=2704465 RepID=A0A6C0GHD2_9BACT|nr:hypothetical protein [Rhodocytophaga rosea]QHT67102.1 hypothetical protein GXP67_10795 [Rhodocytophaga rosea]